MLTVIVIFWVALFPTIATGSTGFSHTCGSSSLGGKLTSLAAKLKRQGLSCHFEIFTVVGLLNTFCVVFKTGPI